MRGLVCIVNLLKYYLQILRVYFFEEIEKHSRNTIFKYLNSLRRNLSEHHVPLLSNWNKSISNKQKNQNLPYIIQKEILQMAHPKETTNQQKVKNMLENVQNKIINSSYLDLLSSLHHSSSHKQSTFPSHSPATNQHKPRFSVLKRQEQGLRKKLREIIQTQKISQKSKEKSLEILSGAQSNKKLKYLTIKYQKFEEGLNEKSKLFVEKEQQYKMRMRVLQKEKIKEDCEKRRGQIQKRIEEMKQKRQKNKEQLEKEKNTLKSLKKQKKLYERMTEKFNQKNKELSRKQKTLRMEKSNIFNNISTICQHQEKYDNFLKEKQQSRITKTKESKVVLPEIQSPKSLFFQRMMKYDEKKKEEEKNQKQRKKMMRVLHKEFGERVEKEFKPEVRSVEPKQEKKRVQRTKQEIKQLGNQYFTEGKGKAKKNRAESPVVQEIKTKKQYPNYLAELMRNRDGPIQKKDPHEKVLKEVKKLMNKENLSKNEKIQQFKNYTEIYNKPFSSEKKNDDQMVKILQTKINLLNMLQ